MRAGQPFSMRYPLIEVEGSYGTLLASGSWAAPRYTGARLSPLSEYLFADLDKETIEEWRDNYDNTEKYPVVLPTKGFYNLVNGSYGIGVGASSSIPQYNLKELNNSLITLIKNPDATFEELYIEPDFATGATIINASQVKESHRNGSGNACKLRSTVEWDNKERCFIVTEIPYMTYTETICKELEEIINGESNPGIERFNDLTGKTPLIKIYLHKNANPDRLLKFLYKNTSLESYYGINFTMLDNGRFPKVFTWKEMLQSHIDHEKVVYRRGFEYDLRKIEKRLHIIDGLLICCANIEEVVKLIKSSKSTAEASSNLCKSYLLDADQAKAVLDTKLSRLAHLEIEKLEKEKENLENEAKRIKEILNDEQLFNQQLINGWNETSRKFGDERRTKIIDLSSDSSEEVIERKQLSLSFTNNASVYVSESSTLYSQKRNGVGSKFKLEDGEVIVDNIIGQNTDTILFFGDHGNFYHMKMSDFTIGEKQYLNNFITTLSYEKIVAAAIPSKKNVIFLTKNGILKKSELSEYNMKRNSAATAIKLDEGDTIVSVMFTDEERIGILSKCGQFVIIETKDIRPIGRVARGVVGMKLNSGDEVVSARTIPTNVKEVVSISEDGYIKRTSIDEFRVTGRGTKGVKIMTSDKLCDFIPAANENDILINSSNSQIRLKYLDISLLSRGSQGTKSIKLNEKSKIIKISQF